MVSYKLTIQLGDRTGEFGMAVPAKPTKDYREMIKQNMKEVIDKVFEDYPKHFKKDEHSN